MNNCSDNKIISATGYMGSGSSAITDLFREYDNCYALNPEKEYVFLHCPNGLFDLEDKLIIGNNALRSDEAIKSFYQCMFDLYDKRHYWVGEYKENVSFDFMKYVNEFIDSIVDVTIDAHWYYHENPSTSLLIKRGIYKIQKHLPLINENVKKPFLYKNMELSYISPNEFYDKAKGFIYNVINSCSKNNSNIVIDQLLLPFNLWRIPNYFDDDLRVIVVDRDPRDVFLSNKYYWNKQNVPIPYPTDVYEFCRVYKKIRKIEKSISDNRILRIHFEDLIYKYDETIKIIENFVGISSDKHKNKMKYFNPNKSIQNTQIELAKDYYLKETSIIKQELHDYLYEFPKIGNISHTNIF